MKNSENNQDQADVIAFPPLLYVGAALLGAGLHFLKPRSLPLPRRTASLIGGGLVVTAGLITLSAMRSLRNAETNVHPSKSSSAIVSNGIFRYSRNPMYLSFMLLYLSTGFFLNTVWMSVLAWPLSLLVENGVIKREERYLAGKFGQEYLQYTNTVRRWI